MSKFIDKLKRLSQTAPEPMGFRPRQPATPRPKMQLVAGLAQENLDKLADFAGVADAVLLPGGQGKRSASSLAKIAQGMGEVPWGSWLEENQTDVPGLIKAGGDFIVFSTTQDLLTVVQSNDIGKLLAVEASLGDGLLRAVNELPVDAVLVSPKLKKEGSLTWQHLMVFQRFANALTKPLLVSVPANIASAELKALWGAGVDCLVIEVTTQEELKELRQTIDSLTFPLPRRKEKMEAILPRLGHEPGHVETEEEEEDED